MDQSLRQTLLEMVDESRRVRAELAADGSLFQGYNPALRAIHNAQAKKLADIVDNRGWPGRSMVGEDGAAAAWMVVQQAIGLPRFMRACLELIDAAVAAGQVPRWQVALLTDRIRWLEGRPQVYGTQFDWGPDNQLHPIPIEDEATVDARRAMADLKSLAEGIAQRRKEAVESGEQPPGSDRLNRQQEFDAWAKAVGWRS